MSNSPTLEQLMNTLHQSEPPATLDDNIKGTIQKLLALENYHQAHQLLSTQNARLDAVTKSNLEAGMSATKEQFGKDFDAAYRDFVTQLNTNAAHTKTNEPEHGRG